MLRVRTLFSSVVTLFFLTGVSHAQQSEQNGQSPQIATDASGMLIGRKTAAPEIVLYNPANNHFYQSFDGSFPWDVAAKKAQEHTYNGIKGHLATVTSKEEYDFLVGNIWLYDYWLGGYRDPNFLNEEPTHGWRWVTGEPFRYANWNDGEPNNKETKPEALASWTGSRKWSPHGLTEGTAGYVVEYDNDKPVAKTQPQGAPQSIDKFLADIVKKYSKITSYQATVEFRFKAFRDTVENVKADLMLMPDGRFRLDGRGENGKLLAISDGSRLMLSTIEPGERMKFDVKPMPSLTKALREAFSLLTSSPKPPSIVELITGTFDPRIFSARSVVGEVREGDALEQVVRARTKVTMSGEDPADGDLYLSVGLDKGVITASDLSFRYKAYPYSVRETHSNIRINETIPDNNFVLVITTNAKQVDDLGEGDEVEMTYAVPDK